MDSSTLEKQLDSIHAVQDEIDMFVHRIQGIKEKLHGFEDFVQAQLEDFPRRRDSRDSRSDSQRQEDLGNKARERSGTVDDMKQLQEPLALTEHREKKWESTAGWYWPLSSMSSLTQTQTLTGSTGKELRLHNRWMQLSMQAEALLALSEYKRTQSSVANKLASHNSSGLSDALDHSGPSVFHPLGKVRVVWDLCGLALLLADAILLPLSLAWDWHQGTEEAGSFFLLVVFLVSLLFWSLDIGMNLNTAFYQRGFLVFSRWEILKHYLQTWFIIDVAVVTLDYVTLANYIADAERSSLGQLIRSMRVVRAFRLVRLLKMARFDAARLRWMEDDDPGSWGAPSEEDQWEILVNLSDMSEFIACVRNRFVFETCVSRCKVRFTGGRVQLEMTGSNWARVNEPNSDITSLAYSVKDVLQKQRTLETQILHQCFQGLKRTARFSLTAETFPV